jgi:hypothetical protein
LGLLVPFGSSAGSDNGSLSPGFSLLPECFGLLASSFSPGSPTDAGEADGLAAAALSGKPEISGVGSLASEGEAARFAVTRRARDLFKTETELSDRVRFFLALVCAKAPTIPMFEASANDNKADVILVVFKTFSL